MLLITSSLTIGGADRMHLDLIRQLIRRGYRCSVVATLPGKHEWRMLFEALTPDVVTLHPTIAPEQHPAFIRDLIRSRGIQVVLVSNSQTGYLLMPYLRYHCPDVTFIDLLHAVEPRWLDGGYPRLSLDHASWIDMSITISCNLRQWMIAHGGEPSRIEVCYTGIDTDIWNVERFDRAALRRSLGVADERPLIVFVGRLSAEKRPRLAMQTFRALARRGIPFQALMIGEGPERLVLERMRRDPLLHNVQLVGALPEEQVREVMAAGDILLLPSEREGIAIVLLEAMAMGVVPVAADVGGHRELATSDCGVLIPHSGDEARAYVAALISLLTDPDRRAQMGANARRRVVDHFQLEQMGERVDALIRVASRLHITVPRAAPSGDAAHHSATSVIRQARHDRNVARLWQQIEEPPFPHSGARRFALTLVRRARHTFRPLYRQLAGHDAHPIRRGVLAIRDLATRWIYGA